MRVRGVAQMQKTLFWFCKLYTSKIEKTHTFVKTTHSIRKFVRRKFCIYLKSTDSTSLRVALLNIVNLKGVYKLVFWLIPST